MAKVNDGAARSLLDAFGVLFPAGSTLELRAGDKVVATVDLPEQPWNPAEGRAKDLRGGWSGLASEDGTVDNYRLVSPGDQFEDIGSVSGPGGNGDMRLDNPSLARGQSIFINSFRKAL